MIRTESATDQDVLIAQYLLGLLTPEEAQQVQTVLNTDPDAAKRLLQWEGALLDLVDALPPADPPPSLLDQVLNALDLPAAPEAEVPAAPSQSVIDTETSVGTDTSADTDALVPRDTITTPAQPAGTAADFSRRYADNANPSWHDDAATPRKTTPETTQATALETAPEVTRGTAPETASQAANVPGDPDARSKRKHWWAGAGIAAAALLVLAIMPRTPSEPPVIMVEVAPRKGAILQAPGQSSTPGWVVTVDPENNVSMTPRVYTETPDDASVQLWTYTRAMPAPRSLGLIDPNQPVVVPAELMQEVGEGQFFEMTLEPRGGSPTGEPGGPVLFIGRVVTF